FLALVPALRLEPLVSHRFPIERAEEAYALLLGERPEPYLGILLTYPEVEASPAPSLALHAPQLPSVDGAAVGVSVVGAGNYARATLLPALAKVGRVRRVSIVTAKGLTAWDAGRRFGFEACSTDIADALRPEVDLGVVATRHGDHAGLVQKILGERKAVFVEKPLCVSEEELSGIVERYEAAPAPFLM